MHHIVIAMIIIVVGILILGTGQMIKSMANSPQKWQVDLYNKLHMKANVLMVLGGVIILCGLVLIGYEMVEEDESKKEDKAKYMFF